MTKPTTVILTDAAADLWGSHMLVNLDRPELTKLPEGALIHPDHKVHAAYSVTDGDGRPAGHLWKGSYQDESRKTWFVRRTVLPPHRFPCYHSNAIRAHRPPHSRPQT